MIVLNATTGFRGSREVAMTGEDSVQIRGDDAADHAASAANPTRPRPEAPKPQDAPNYDRAIDGGRAEPVENLNSANDE